MSLVIITREGYGVGHRHKICYDAQKFKHFPTVGGVHTVDSGYESYAASGFAPILSKIDGNNVISFIDDRYSTEPYNPLFTVVNKCNLYGEHNLHNIDNVECQPSIAEFAYYRYKGLYHDIDVKYFNGLIYVAKPGGISIFSPNAESAAHNYVERNYLNDDDYRLNYRKLIPFKNRMLSLETNGKLYEIHNSGISELYDFSNLLNENETFIDGYGVNQYDDSVSINGYLRAGMCYGAELGDKLEVFLNYEDGNKCGVFWGESTDIDSDSTYSNLTSLLPQSGIIPPSGMSESGYLAIISPYKYSGYNGIPLASGKTALTECRPSGWTQIGSGDIVLWGGSGTFYNNDYGIDPSGWDVPMYYNNRNYFLSPTEVIIPVSGMSRHSPSGGIAESGLRWTGVKRYNIMGYKDEDNEELHLFFGGANSGVSQEPLLYYTLNSSGNWTFKNETKTGKLFDVELTDMFEPSILIPSGSIQKRYPYYDYEDDVVYQPIKIFNWPTFENVDIEAEYTIDKSSTWNVATVNATYSDSMTNIDTGDLSTDPSGVNGVSVMFAWDYISDIGTSFIPWAQLRFRAVTHE